jgi:hypothetical protein
MDIMSDRPPTSPPPDSSRRIDPEIEAAARHSDMPDGQLYDTDVTSGPGSLWALGAVLVVVAVLVGVFIIVAMHWRPGK